MQDVITAITRCVLPVRGTSSQHPLGDARRPPVGGRAQDSGAHRTRRGCRVQDVITAITRCVLPRPPVGGRAGMSRARRDNRHYAVRRMAKDACIEYAVTASRSGMPPVGGRAQDSGAHRTRRGCRVQDAITRSHRQYAMARASTAFGSEPVVHDDATFDRLFRLLAPGQKLPPQVRAVPTHGLRE